MRRFGRQCRGQGKVFVSLVRQTETQLLAAGQAVEELAQAAQMQLQQAPRLTEEQRLRWDTTLTIALAAHQQIVTQFPNDPAAKSAQEQLQQLPTR
jgi:TolA-binding protein